MRERPRQAFGASDPAVQRGGFLLREGPIAALAAWIALFGVVALAAAGIFWVQEYRWWRSMQHADGVVTELQAQQDDRGEVTYAPRVRFRLPTGEMVQFVSGAGENPAGFAAGDAVPVVYRAQNPMQAEIATRWRVYTASIVLGVLGLVFFDGGFVVLWWVRKKPHRNEALKQVLFGRRLREWRAAKSRHASGH